MSDPFPAAVDRLIAVHDPGDPPTVFPNRKVTVTGHLSSSSPRGGIPSPAVGSPSPGGSPGNCPPAAAAGEPSGGAVPGRRGHTAPPAAPGGGRPGDRGGPERRTPTSRLASALWRAVTPEVLDEAHQGLVEALNAHLYPPLKAVPS